MIPSWPKRIDCGHGWVTLRNAHKTGFSKGKIGDKPEFANETLEEGTRREIKEEMNLDIVLKEKVGDNEYIASDPEAGKKRKQVAYFLAESPYVDVKLKQTGGLDDARWFRLREALELNLYEDVIPIITRAMQKLDAERL